MKEVFAFLKNNFIVLTQTAVWIFSIIATFVFEPLIQNSDTTSWVNFSRFIMAVIIGLSYFMLLKYKLKKHVRLWVITSIVILTLSFGCYNEYRNYFDMKTIEIPQSILDSKINGNENFLRYVIGDNFKDSTLIKLKIEKNRYISIEEFIRNFAAGETPNEKIYRYFPENEVKANVLKIYYLYTLNLILFGLLIISLTQAIKCSSSKT